MVDKSVKSEEIPALLDSLKPAIEIITDPNAKAIINTLIAIIHFQQKEIKALKEKLNANSDNSSKPPSTNPFKSNKNNKKKKKGQRNRGGQTGHPGVTRNLLPESEVDYIEKHQPPSQCECGGDVKTIDEYSRHQVHDIPPITTVVTEHPLFYGCCEVFEMITLLKILIFYENGL